MPPYRNPDDPTLGPGGTRTGPNRVMMDPKIQDEKREPVQDKPRGTILFPRRDLGRSLLHVGRELDGGLPLPGRMSMSPSPDRGMKHASRRTMVNVFERLGDSLQTQKSYEKTKQRTEVGMEYLKQLEQDFQDQSNQWRDAENVINDQAKKLEKVARYSYVFNQNMLEKLDYKKIHKVVLTAFTSWRGVVWRKVVVERALHLKKSNDTVMKALQAYRESDAARPFLEFKALYESYRVKKILLLHVGDAYKWRLRHYFQLWRVGMNVAAVTRIFSSGYEDDEEEGLDDVSEPPPMVDEKAASSRMTVMSSAFEDDEEAIRKQELSKQEEMDPGYYTSKRGAYEEEFRELRAHDLDFNKKIRDLGDIEIDGNAMFLSKYLLFGWSKLMNNLDARRKRARRMAAQKPREKLSKCMNTWRALTDESEKKRYFSRMRVRKEETVSMTKCFVCWTCLPAINRQQDVWMHQLAKAQGGLDDVRRDWEAVVVGLEEALAAECVEY
jgi:hypothetical protein